MAVPTDLRRQQRQQQRHQHDTRTSLAPRSKSKKTTAVAALRLLTVATSLILPLVASATIYEVSPDGQPYSIAGALAEAGPGDTVSLADGTYDEPIVTVAGGEAGNPLVIEGGPNAVISAYSEDLAKIVHVQHSWVTVRGFTLDGRIAEEESIKSFVDKCVWVEGIGEPTTRTYRGGSVKSSLIGFVLEGMTIRNCGGECVRLRNFVTNSRILDNTIDYCGLYDYRFSDGGENGEAIYVGTSSNQWTDGPDGSNHNLISGNVMKPFGNECVDVKEGATGNVIQNNQCAEQLDPDSGCYGSRGSGNIFRYNTGANCVGAGIRLGGWEVDGITYGTENEVYDNRFETTGAGSIAARQAPQGIVCGNTCDQGSGDCEVLGEDEGIMVTWNQRCPERLPAVPFIDDENYIEPTFTTSSTEESTAPDNEQDGSSSITTSSTEASTTSPGSDEGGSSSTTSSSKTKESTSEGNEKDDSSSTSTLSTQESTAKGSDEDGSTRTSTSSTEESSNKGSQEEHDSSSITISTAEESATHEEEEESAAQGSDDDSDDGDDDSNDDFDDDDSDDDSDDDDDDDDSDEDDGDDYSDDDADDADDNGQGRRWRHYRPGHV